MVDVHGENQNVDYLIKFREIILSIEKDEEHFDNYLKFLEENSKRRVIPSVPLDETEKLNECLERK
jgi:ABC-type uncharacterized transport system involved in gliding motility auxiliary subunit